MMFLYLAGFFLSLFIGLISLERNPLNISLIFLLSLFSWFSVFVLLFLDLTGYLEEYSKQEE